MKNIKYKVKRAKQITQTKLIRLYYRLKYRGQYVPWFLQLEPTNRCNANCLMCNRAYVEPREDLEMETYRQMIDALPFITQVNLNGTGEPLLCKALEDAIKYAKSKGKRVVFYTNASLLDEKRAYSILKTGVDQVRFSVDTDNAEHYEYLRPPLKWDVVIKNIEKFKKIRDEHNYQTSIALSVVISEADKDRVDEIKAFWKDRVDMISTTPEIDMPTPADIMNPITYDKEEPMKCDWINEHLVVKSNGDVYMCCHASYMFHIQGNLFHPEISEKNVIDVFNNGSFTRIREALKTGIDMPATCVLSCGRLRKEVDV